jgi:hypothetical protein
MLMILMLMMGSIRMLMLMRMSHCLPLLPILLARQVLLPAHPNIHLGSGNPTPHHPRNLKPSLDSQRGNRLFQQPGRNSGIHKRAQKHVATHAGKTLKVGNPHSQKRR